MTLLALSATLVLAQSPAKNDAPAEPKAPQVRVNYLNVCTAAEADQKTMLATLARVPLGPKFAADFEASHGLTSLKDAPDSRYVRLRRDFAEGGPFTTAQYSLSSDKEEVVETLVLHPRDTKEALSITIEDGASAAAPPTAMLATNTPATRIKIERFGKPSLVVAHCETADQSALKPIFDSATHVLSAYRDGMRIKTSLAPELRWIAAARPVTGKQAGKAH